MKIRFFSVIFLLLLLGMGVFPMFDVLATSEKTGPQLINQGDLQALTQQIEQQLRLEPDSAVESIKKYESQFLAEGVSPEWRAVYYRLTGNWHTVIGDIEGATEAFDQAHQLLANRPESATKGRILYELGTAYQSSNRLQEALQSLLQSLDTYRVLQSDSGITVITERIALLHWQQNQPQKALEGLQQSLRYKQQTNDSLGMGMSFTLLGNVHAQLGELEIAAAYFQKSIGIWQQLQQAQNLAMSINNLANVRSAQGNKKDAEKLYLKSIQLKELLGDQLGLAGSYNNFGDFYFDQNDLERALTYFEKSAHISRQMANPKTWQVAEENLAITLEELGKFEESIQHFWQSDSLKTELSRELYNTEVAALQEKFEAEKRSRQILELENENHLKVLALEQERGQRLLWIGGSLFLLILLVFATAAFRQNRIKNRLLRANNARIEQQRLEVSQKNEELESITATKDRLYSIIAHNLKGPISALEGISEVIQYYRKHGPPEKLDRIVAEIDKTAYQTNTLVGNLLNWARTQTQVIPYRAESLNLLGILTQCLELVAVQAERKNLRVELAVPDSLLVFSDLNFIKTVANNLLHNAIKFTPEGGNILLQANEQQNWVEVSIKDSGIGIEPKRLAAIFDASDHKSTQGTAGEQGTGLGLYVCREFIHQAGGKIWVAESSPHGTEFRFTLPATIQ